MRILITGVSARAMAESACRAGWADKVLTVDYFGDRDLKASCDNYSLRRDGRSRYSVAGLLKACDQFRWNAVVYTANLENHPDAVKRLASRGRLLGNGPSTLSGVRNPERFLRCLARAGFPIPRTPLRSRAAAFSGALLEKPVKGGGGRGITMVSSGKGQRRGAYLQEYVAGLPCSVAFVADGRRAVLLGVSQQLIGDAAFGAGGFRYCGSLLGKDFSGSPASDRLIENLEAIIGHLTSTFHLVGVNGLDFILQGSEVYPLELNPRYTASMELVEMAYGLSIFSTHVSACNGLLPAFDLRRAPEECCGKAILFAEGDAIAAATGDWQHRGIRDIPFPGERIRAGSPICTILVRGPSVEDCYQALRAKADSVRQELRCR
jgi:hypothetical protein